MPAKTRSPRGSKILSIQERLKAHVEASRQCEWWAKQALEDQAAGRKAAASAAYAKARRYMAKMIALEPK